MFPNTANLLSAQALKHLCHIRLNLWHVQCCRVRVHTLHINNIMLLWYADFSDAQVPEQELHSLLVIKVSYAGPHFEELAE